MVTTPARVGGHQHERARTSARVRRFTAANSSCPLIDCESSLSTPCTSCEICPVVMVPLNSCWHEHTTTQRRTRAKKTSDVSRDAPEFAPCPSCRQASCTLILAANAAASTSPVLFFGSFSNACRSAPDATTFSRCRTTRPGVCKQGSRGERDYAHLLATGTTHHPTPLALLSLSPAAGSSDSAFGTLRSAPRRKGGPWPPPCTPGE